MNLRPDGRCDILLWAPKAQRVELQLTAPVARMMPLEQFERGYFGATLDDIPAGARYRFRLDGRDAWPDPTSRSQPNGVHGDSEVVDPAAFPWTDGEWSGVPQDKLVLYELHVGTFSPEGTFDGVVRYLPYLRELGVTALEIMPIASFPGERNWGYDGASLFAPQASYGGPEGFRRLVNAAHEHGLAVFLDCVYNHFGPEGNYTGLYGDYLTNKYVTPWGQAVNFDGHGSDEVRRFFIENALLWVRDYHVDGFRLDATDRILDESATHFLQQLTTAIHAENPNVIVIAESDANDVRYVRPAAQHGHGLNAQWGDDLHHALHALNTGEHDGYYAGFGTVEHLAKAMRQNFVYDGVYSSYRQRTFGNDPAEATADQFVVCCQNHDQVGNRATGDRLGAIADFEQQKLAAATYLLSPYIPLIFMGEEYGETAPFQFFTSHTDPHLAKAVTEGRRREFAAFDWLGQVPDPQDPATFARSKLNHGLRNEGPHAQLLAFYRELLRLRREIVALANLSKDDQQVAFSEEERWLTAERWHGESRTLLVLSFNAGARNISVPATAGRWRVLLDSTDVRYGGPGGAHGEVNLERLERPPNSALLLEHVGG